MAYYVEHFEVGSHDTDVNDNARPSIILRYMQEAANHHMRDRKPSLMDLINNNQTFISTRTSIEIYAQLHQYDKIEVRTWNCPGKLAVFRRCYEIWRGEELCARGYAEFAGAEFVSRTVLSANEIDLSNYEAGEPFDLNIPKKYRFPKDLEFSKVDEHVVFYGEVDMNGHLNNTYYPDILWSAIPDVMEKEVTSMNMRFMHEASRGDCMEITMADPGTEFSKDPNAEETKAFISNVNGEKNFEIVFGLKPAKKVEWMENLKQRMAEAE